jgi:hypothetical protein
MMNYVEIFAHIPSPAQPMNVYVHTWICACTNIRLRLNPFYGREYDALPYILLFNFKQNTLNVAEFINHTTVV